MMTIIYLTISAILIIVGIIGCILPIIPGQVIAYCGLLCLVPSSHSPSWMTLLFFGVLTVVVTVLDFVVPAIGAKRFNCSSFGTWGCFIGTLIGLFFPPIGIVLGPFIGAFVGELIAGKPASAAVIGGFGAFLGFLMGTFIKIIACILMLICYIRCL